ncbi:MAG: pglJ 2 [Sphingobacteriales bacterium]|nr:pglJ 2 [Sphingobacteriales bacterium]
MRIGFDGKRATQNFTGLGNYSRYILNILSTYCPENTYHLYSQKEPVKPGLINSRIALVQPKKKKLNVGWRSFGIVKDLKKDKIDLFHGLSNEIPFGIKKSLIPSIVTIHDLIFLRFPQYYNFIDRKIYGFKFKYACKNANKIIAVSEQTKRDIITFFRIDPEKIKVIYQNCASEFKNSERKHEISIKYQLPEKYILNVGSIEERKNILVIVKALKYISDDIHLVIVGKETVYANKVKKYIEDNGLTARVHILKNVPFIDLPSLYQLAKVFVYPSKFEGFGIPILEAMQSGIPVIAATGSCLEEAGGPNSLYVDPENVDGFAKAINQVNENIDLKAKMIREGHDYAKRFDDHIIAKQILDLYKETIK